MSRWPWLPSFLYTRDPFINDYAGTLSRFRVWHRRGMDWWMDFLTTYTHHSELRVIKMLSLISTIYNSQQRPLTFFYSLLYVSSPALPWKRLLTVEILQLHALKFCLQTSVAELNTQLTTARLVAISHRPPSLLFTGWISTDWIALIVFLITTLYGPNGKRLFQQ
jgi:hypothetical protein